MDRKTKRHQISEQFIFSWIPQKNTARTLSAFVIFSCMIHFIGFYLFRVAYPDPVSADLRPNRIMLLDPKNDDVMAFLARTSDRGVFLEPPSQNSISRIKLSDHAIPFVPSFAETRPVLKDSSEDPADFKYPIPEPPVRTRVESWKNPVEFSPNLLKRGIAPSTILDDYLSLIPNVPRFRINLTVKPDGKPVDVYIANGDEDENLKILAEAIAVFLRFNPGDESRGDDPGWLELGGEVN